MTTTANFTLAVLLVGLPFLIAGVWREGVYLEHASLSENIKDELVDQPRFRRAVATDPITNDTRTPIEYTDHKYYISAHFPNRSDLFLDLKSLHLQNDSNVYFHEYLSNAYGRVHTRNLKFMFPFYGHLVESVRIATGGFLHIGPVFHSFITETQYVAPLMANFNPTLKPANRSEPKIFVYDDGQRFITQWDSVALHDQPEHGQFTFQVSLFRNGSIIFAYKTVPVQVSLISTAQHAVRVGLSDAFIFTQKIHDFIHRRIYRYHVVDLDSGFVADSSAFVVHPIQNCITAKTCNECLSGGFPSFSCGWCAKLSLCSDTYDWHRQAWFDAGCNTQAATEIAKCVQTTSGETSEKGKSVMRKHVSPGVVSGGIFLALVIIAILGGVGFYFYAYTHPNSRAGLYVIEHGPRTWFRKKDNIIC